ncbi:MAG TPA: hypothetical protein VKU93_08640 [Terracidiphilus sp.]|nr:hypothetical protein [Terracidiphilus sp.]
MKTSRLKTNRLGWLLAALLALPAAAVAQNVTGNELPPGTLLPVALGHGIDAGKLRAGDTIHAKVMQSIPGTPVRRGASVVGRVVAVSSGSAGPAQVAIRFDAVRAHGRTIAVSTDLRALASPMEVQMAQVPEEMSSRGLTPETWTTQQIGGDQVYRGGGPVARGQTPVGKPVPYGVEAVPQPAANGSCQGAEGNGQPQALWLFSSNACGVYGFSNLRIEHAGRSSGTIVLSSSAGKLKIGGGSALLLRVRGS